MTLATDESSAVDAIGIKYQSISTVPQVFELVGDDVCARWEKLGDLDSKIHWQYGQEADALISEGVPSMLVYKAIAIKAGKSTETIKRAYYTFRSFTSEQRIKYDLAPYSVFRHAAQCDEPENVLQHYIDNRASVDEIEVVYPVEADREIEADFRLLKFPRWAYGIFREIWGIAPDKKKKVLLYLTVIKRTIDEANK